MVECESIKHRLGLAFSTYSMVAEYMEKRWFCWGRYRWEIS